MDFRNRVIEDYKKIQDDICRGLEAADGSGKFVEELWDREGGGGGRTRVMQNGSVIERGGVNFSAVHGKLPEAVRKSFGVEEDEFFASGVSIVIHPNNPWVPIIHMNIRYFELNEELRWFGGGIDLTPHYVVPEEARFFHRHMKEVCDRYSANFYTEFKEWADRYFFIRHRQETRGVGGIFYDRLTPAKTGLAYEQILEFSKEVGNSFVPVYTQLMASNKDRSFGEKEKAWQYYRRGRYVEFNLVYDAGTKFGLETNGRIESILMSLPPTANWVYNFEPEAGSQEADTLALLKQGMDWIS
jgi:coproporphyrinogen III oxidase